MSKMLNKDLIVGAQDAKVVKLEIPEWGGHVFVRSMSGRDRDWFEQTLDQHRKQGGASFANFRAKFATLVVCDEKGNLLFSEKDVESLGAKNSDVLDKILTAGMRVSGVDSETEKEAESFFENGQTS